MSDLKPCPFCKRQPDIWDSKKVKCTSADCPMFKVPAMRPFDWNRRPVEDALQAELDKWRERAGGWKTADGVWVWKDVVYMKVFDNVVCFPANIIEPIYRDMHYSTREAAEQAAREGK